MQLPNGLEPWQVWLGLAIALGVLELFSLDLILLMLAVGAVVGMVGAFLELDLWAQVLAAVAASLAGLGLLRPGVLRRLHTGPELVLGHRALIGKTGVVIEEVSSETGQVRIAGEVWTARPYDGDSVIKPGSRVDVFQIEGATAMVHEVPEIG